MIRQSKQNNDFQLIQFSTFKSKKLSIMTVQSENTFKLQKPNNVFTLALAITYFLKKSPEIFKQSPFCGITMEQVPRCFLPYQHDQTLLSLLNLISTKIISPEHASELINSYPIVQFVFTIFIRNLVINQIVKNQNQNKNIQMMGNEEQILSDYSVQIRGNLLTIAAECLDIYMIITYDKDTNIIQEYGNPKSKIKLQAKFQEQSYNFSILNNTLNPSLRLQSPKQSYLRKTPLGFHKHSSEEYRGNGQSRSVNKQFIVISCRVCYKKTSACDCNMNNNRFYTKGFPSKVHLNQAYNTMSPLNSIKSNLNPQPYIPHVFKQTNNKDSKKCLCNRSYCRYCQQG